VAPPPPMYIGIPTAHAHQTRCVCALLRTYNVTVKREKF